MSVYRYINNSDEPVVAGNHTVPAWGEIILNEPTDELNFKVGTYLDCIKNGEIVDSAMMPILDYVDTLPTPSTNLELYDVSSSTTLLDSQEVEEVEKAAPIPEELTKEVTEVES